MKSRHRIMCAILFSLLFGALLTPLGTSASGYSYISGVAYHQDTWWYLTERYVTDPSQLGAEVAFYQTSGPYMALGAWNCQSTYGVDFYTMIFNDWTDVAYSASPFKYCLGTWSHQSTSTFGGDLWWD